jgi:putative transcriptional regulator
MTNSTDMNGTPKRTSKREEDIEVAIVRRTLEEVRSSKGRIDRAKFKAVTESEIAAWKVAEGIDDTKLGPAEFVAPSVDVRQLRERLGLSQGEFARRYLLSLRTIQEWEQHRREPSEPARVLLFAIKQNPKAIEKALH